MSDPNNSAPYEVESVARACRILKSFRSPDELLRLQEIALRTQLNPSTTLRLLRTLEAAGFVKRGESRTYRSTLPRLHRPRRKVGFVVDTAGKPFRKEVAEGIEQAAAENDVDLISIDAEGTLRNARRAAQQLIRSEIDLAIDFQTGPELGESVASQYLEQGIPLIAIDVPHPGATFFGVNNYIAGKAGGHWLAGWVRRQWHAKIDSVVLICPPQVNVVTARARGAYAGLQERLGRRAKTPAAIELKSPGTIEASFRALQKFLRRGRRGNVLVVAPSDTCVTGVMMALEEAGSAVQAAVFGFGGARETRALLRDPRARFIGCVAFAPEQYGRKLIPTALRLIEGRTVPPAVFIDHDIIHCENVDLLYPNDVL